MSDQFQRIEVIDSHTAGEPTRVVMSGGPDLGNGSLEQRRAIFAKQHDGFRAAVVNEPRGSDVLVGAFLTPPVDPDCAAGVIFFNNVGCLGMCGHGLIGVITTLAHVGRLRDGIHRMETPVGEVSAELHADGQVSVENVPSCRKAKNVVVALPSGERVTGDVAWGGNWFFLCSDHGQELRLDRVERLTPLAWEIRQAVNALGFAEVDHVELFGPPADASANARNFVLCPGKAFDRSPCGTGTSAKIACLAEDGALAEGQNWVQEGILGTRFVGRYAMVDGMCLPTITGAAHITAEASLVLDARDPFRWGFGASGTPVAR